MIIEEDGDKKYKILHNTRQKCGCFFYMEQTFLKEIDLEDGSQIPQINLEVKRHKCEEHDTVEINVAIV